ncbi:M56 family metallopeptidase [Clostridium transplantifaecale]|uniref:M56 family metallopeptidase n=1 Tax=Clostridium transplantifaecale TaxID=2479838 RepID=UPI000F6410DB|nr:M56 family metallopeptidase [Clostridium transplantifaecale]
MSLLQMSFSAAVMILIITVIRALFINRLPKATFIALWGIALIRLLVPFSLPSPLSVYSLANRSEAIHIPVVPASGMPGTPAAGIPPLIPTASAMPVSAFAAGITLWGWIWIAGTALCALYFTIAYIRCRRGFMTSLPAENDFAVEWLASHRCNRPLSIRRSGSITAPLTYGLFRPVILMPVQTDWADTKKLRYILTHEYVHIRRFDGGTKLLLAAALCIHWFNPLVWVMYILANRDLELSCDEKVVRMFGETVKSAYALTLIDMEEQRIGLTPLCSHFSKNAIEERIEAIMKIKKFSMFTIIIAFAVVATVGSTFATSAAAAENKPYDPVLTKEHIVLSPDYTYAYKFLPAPDIYAKYSSYGISISDDGTALLYNGQKVKLFMDPYSDTEAFYYDEDGAAYLSASRDSSGKITGVNTISKKDAETYRDAFFDYDATNGNVINGIKDSVKNEAGTNGTKYDEYLPYGITLDAEKDSIYFNGQRVRMLVDERKKDGFFYTFWADEAGTVDLSVVRDSSDRITRIEALSKEKEQEYLESARRQEQDEPEDLEDRVTERAEKRIHDLYPDL